MRAALVEKSFQVSDVADGSPQYVELGQSAAGHWSTPDRVVIGHVTAGALT